MKSNLWIVTTSFDEWESTARCLTRLEPARHAYSVIVVAHGSDHKHAQRLVAQFPGVTVVQESPDLWWTGATNAGIRYALERGAHQVMLLNSDCEIEPSSVERLASAARDSGAVVAPIQQDLDTGVLIGRAWTGIWVGCPTLRAERSVPHQNLVSTKMIIGGRGVVISRAVFELVGLFDEALFPHYLADHDFYLRCRRYNVQLMIDTTSVVLVGSKTTSIAHDTGQLSSRAFASSLTSPRSHRNLPSLTNFFRLHYPLPQLWWIGVALALLRHTSAWTIARALHHFRYRFTAR